jgi:transposase InsO family protein
MYLGNATTPGKLQMDVKYVTPELSGLAHTTYLYAIMDIWTRYKQGAILPLLDQQGSVMALETVAPLLPLTPDFIQTDNGLEFQSSFHRYVTGTLGWDHHYIHKSAPNENAVIERSFRSDEEEFFWRMDVVPDSLDELNRRYQEYLQLYNTYRPHLGIDLQTPQERLEYFQGVQ